MRGLCVVALGLSGFLAWSAFRAGDIAGCAAEGMWDCSHVLHSRWSKWFGIPVSIPALALYMSLAGTLLFVDQRVPPQVRALAWRLGTVLALAAAAAGVWFLSLQVFVLGSLCKYCVAVHTISLILGAMVLWFRRDEAWRLAGFAGLGLAAASVLIVGQVFGPSAKTYQLEEHQSAVEIADDTMELFEMDELDENDTADDVTLDEAHPTVDATTSESTDTGVAIAVAQPKTHTPDLVGIREADEPAASVPAPHDPAPSYPPVPTPTPLPDETQSDDAPHNTGTAPTSTSTDVRPIRLITFPGARAKLNVLQWPMLGASDAPHVLVELFDYTCPHCRRMNEHLDVARQRYGSQLAVVVLPVPLDGECNRTVEHTSSRHAEACEIARLALAVWKVDPAVFPEYHRWLFEPAAGRTATEARRKAEALVDPVALSAQLHSQLVGKFIAKHVAIYQRAGQGTLPKLFSERISLRGNVGSAEELCSLLERNHGLARH